MDLPFQFSWSGDFCNNEKNKKKLVNNKTGVSQRKIANSLNINQSTVSRSIKKIGLKYKKCCRAPKATEAQKKRQSERLEKLCNGPMKQKEINQDIVIKMFEN